MLDLFDEVYAVFEETAPQWDEIASRMRGTKYDESALAGKAAKYHLRIVANNLVRLQPLISPTTVPHTSYSRTQIDGLGFLIKSASTGRDITTFDYCLEKNGKVLVLDIRTGQRAFEKYFGEDACLVKGVILDDAFSKTHERAILIPYDVSDHVKDPIYRGVNIVRLPFSSSEFTDSARLAHEFYNLECNKEKLRE